MTRPTASPWILVGALALAITTSACSSSDAGTDASPTTVEADASTSTTMAATTTSAPAETSTSAVADATTTIESTATTTAATTAGGGRSCVISGTVTGDVERTWTDQPIEVQTDQVLPSGARSPATYTFSDATTIFSAYAAGTGPIVVQLGVVGGAGSKTYVSGTSDAASSTIAADGSGGRVDAFLTAGADDASVAATITC